LPDGAVPAWKARLAQKFRLEQALSHRDTTIKMEPRTTLCSNPVERVTRNGGAIVGTVLALARLAALAGALALAGWATAENSLSQNDIGREFGRGQGRFGNRCSGGDR
jgi:hypothetical protein